MDKLSKLAETYEKIGPSTESDYLDCIQIAKSLTEERSQIENQLKVIEFDCIADYMKESDKITDLFQRVNVCDQILEQLESILCKFQADLGNICQEIISLHEQTVSLNRQLENKESIKSKLGDSIRSLKSFEHVEAMSKVYYNNFKDYLIKLSRLEYDDKPDEYDLMAADDHHKARKHRIKNRSTVFSMGTRSSVLKENLTAPLIDANNVKQDVRYTPEAIFRTIHFSLLENACQEYNFLKESFKTSGDKQTCELFNSIFSKTLNHIYNYFAEKFRISFDSIAIFLSLHLVYRYKELAKKRNVNALQEYWDSMILVLYPRFEKLVQLNIRSVKNCDCEKFVNVDTLPHPITRRYAEFASAISTINDTFPDDKVTILLMDLQNEVKNFILRTAAIFNQPKEQQIFMINNYDHILSLFKRSNTREDSKDIEEIKLQLDKRIKEIVEELLYPHFGSVICLVKDCEVYLERDDLNALKRNETKIGPLIDGFNENWQNALGIISKDIMSWFSNFENGNKIQQATMAQLLQYHIRFQKILNHPALKDVPNKGRLINLEELMLHVKKYKTNF